MTTKTTSGARRRLIIGTLALALAVPTAAIAIAHDNTGSGAAAAASEQTGAETQTSTTQTGWHRGGGNGQGMGQGHGKGQGTGQGTGQGQGRGQGMGQSQGAGAGARAGNSTEKSDQTLSPDVARELTYLAEEEKVAHDLYVLANDLYGIQTFANISESETRHFSAMNNVLDRYGLPSRTVLGKPGEFTDPDLQSLYDQLAAKVRSSRDEAVAVGVTVEKTDITDLTKASEMDVPSDVTFVLQRLIRASQQHLSAFQSL